MLKYLTIFVVFVAPGALTFNNETRLSNTAGMSCSSYWTQRSIVTDSQNRVHIIWNEYEGGKSSCGHTHEMYVVSELNLPFNEITNLIHTGQKFSYSISNIYYRRSIDGGSTWQDSVKLATVSAHTPCIATDNMNMVHVVWADTRDGNDEIYYMRSVDGGANWESAVRLTVSDSASVLPAIISVGNDTLHLIWREDWGTTFKLYYDRSTDGGANWGTIQELSTAAPVFVWFDSLSGHNVLPVPAIAGADDLVHVVCHDSRDEQHGEIYYKRSTDGGLSWEPDVRLTTDTLYSFWPSLAAAHDMVYTVWVQRTAPEDTFVRWCFRRSTDGGTSWEPVICPSPNALVLGKLGMGVPRIDAKNQSVAVTWGDYRDGNPEIYFKESTDGGVSWSNDTRVSFDTAGSIYPSVKIDDLDSIHIVWSDSRDGNWEIYYSKQPVTGVEEQAQTEIVTTRMRNHPNPFYSHTEIRFNIPSIPKYHAGIYTALRIYNLSGQLVHNLMQAKKKPGTYTVSWDGRTETGKDVTSGIYFCELQMENYIETKKMILLK